VDKNKEARIKKGDLVTWGLDQKAGIVLGFIGGKLFEGDNIIKVLSTHSQKPALIMESRARPITESEDPR